jgi:hypothetical protein
MKATQIVRQEARSEDELDGVHAFGALLRGIKALPYAPTDPLAEDPLEGSDFDWYGAQRLVQRQVEQAFGPMPKTPFSAGLLKAITWFLVLHCAGGWRLEPENFDDDEVLRDFAMAMTAAQEVRNEHPL